MPLVRHPLRADPQDERTAPEPDVPFLRRAGDEPAPFGARIRRHSKQRAVRAVRHPRRRLLRRRLRPLRAIDEPGRSAARQAAEPLIRLRGVEKAYDDGSTRHEVLAGVDLDVLPGELVALLGPSGSGKSTLLNLVAGLDAPDAGTVHVAGRDVARLDERGRTLLRRHEIGFVFQFFNLVPTLTVLENIRLPLELTGRRDGDAALALLERTGLGHRARAFPEELSGGEQQRVAVARALAHGPRLVLADEPTGNLDASTGAVVLDLLAELVRERGTTMLVATHSSAVVERAGRVVALEEGRLRTVS
jgi:putative ABC transport system ATP-binding protein